MLAVSLLSNRLHASFGAARRCCVWRQRRESAIVVRTMQRTMQPTDWLSVLVVASCSALLLFRRRQNNRTKADGGAIKVAELVCAKLGAIDNAWAGVAPAAVVVEDCSGHGSAVGGVCTYQVSAMVADSCAERALLRQWSIRQGAAEQRLFVQRWRAACRAFVEHGIGPRRLAEQQLLSEGHSDGWSIEEWPGTALHPQTLTRSQPQNQL